MTNFRVCLNLYRHLPVTKPETSPVEQVPRFHHRPPHKSPRFPAYPQPFLCLFNLLPISLLLRESARNASDDLPHRESPRNSTNRLRIICVSSPLTTTRSENRTATTSPEIVLSPTMVTEAEVSVQYRHCVPKEPAVVHQIEVASSQILHEVRVANSVPTEFTRVDSVLSCSENLKDAAMDSSKSKYLPCIRSGSHADIGCRTSMEDEHIRIDDLTARLDSSNFCIPSAFYAVFDGHGGPEAAAYIKRNVMRLLFEDILLPEVSEIDDSFLKQLEDSHREAYLQADLALANEPSVSSSCGTTALTALVLGKHLLVANAGDCRAVLCRRGTAIEMSQDHRPSYVPERKRVEESGGFILDGYLNGYLSITRALGDWDVKLPLGFDSPLTAEPDFQWATLTEEDEFLIIACDGIWDVMSSQSAVSLVRRGLRRHNDPQQCARELVMDALRLNTSDNVTVIIVCLSSPEPFPPLRRRLRCCNLSEEARNRLRSLLGGNGT